MAGGREALRQTEAQTAGQRPIDDQCIDRDAERHLQWTGRQHGRKEAERKDELRGRHFAKAQAKAAVTKTSEHIYIQTKCLEPKQSSVYGGY